MNPKPLKEVIRPTTIIEAPRLARRLGVELTVASETFQFTGSFKFRAAYNLASKVREQQIITASSGNFGQAMAYACRLLGKSCTIVMPATSAQVKIDAVREFGGTVDLIDVREISRAARVAQLAAENPDAYVASAYDDPLVIEGNASLGAELAALAREFDYVVAPVGGGGLTSGLIKGLREAVSSTRVVGAEPLLANDAARSLRAGHIVANDSEVQTIADGARTVSVGQHNWAILESGLAHIVEVPEENIREGLRLLFTLANLKAEPTGALAIGALLTAPERFRDRRVCAVISGGNVDAEVYRQVLAAG
ncbi:MAG TPA: pyridoxal-phosphate dependent enzyme [Blastocatellia bacterium]|nr:pyridoxal-phosphate dependent enzyme [Blastocatellia bacterium]